MMPQYSPTPYNPNASATGYQQQPYYQPPPQQQQQPPPQPSASYQGSQFQSYSTQDDPNSLFGTPQPSRNSISTPVRVEDRSVSLKVEITSKIQYELERMFKRIRGKLCGGCASLALCRYGAHLEFDAQTTLTCSSSTSFSSPSRERMSSEGSSRSSFCATTCCERRGSSTRRTRRSARGSRRTSRRSVDRAGCCPPCPGCCFSFENARICALTYAALADAHTQEIMDPDTILVESDGLSKQYEARTVCSWDPVECLARLAKPLACECGTCAG